MVVVLLLFLIQMINYLPVNLQEKYLDLNYLPVNLQEKYLDLNYLLGNLQE